MNQDYVHVGVFVECLNPLRETPHTVDGCVNANCTNYHNEIRAPYCGECGSPFGQFAVIQREPSVEWYVVSVNIDEALFPAILSNKGGYDIWLPNKSVDGGAGIDTEETGEVVDIPAETRAAHIANFERGLSAGLAGLREAYGAENVTVRWGVVTYTN